ncbi:MAG: glycosyltransferase family 9 protein [bacterium]
MPFYVRRKNFRRFRNFLIASLIDAVGGVVFLPARLVWFVSGRMGPGGAARERVRRISVVKLDHMGDVLLATPALHALRERFPGAEITCVAGSWSAPALERNPDVDRVTVADAPWYARGGGAGWSDFIRALKALRLERYDVCVVLRRDVRDLAVGFACRSGVRVGPAGKGGGFMLTHPVAYEPGLTPVEQNMRITAAVGAAGGDAKPLVRFSPSAGEKAEKWFRQVGAGGDGLVVGVAPDAGLPVKRWTAEGWAAVTRHLIEKRDARVIFLGGAGAVDVVNEITARVPRGGFLDISGKTTFDESAAVVSRLSLLLTLDSAPRHVAAAFSVPAVILQWAATDRDEWRSYADNQVVVRESVPCDSCGMTRCPYPGVPCMSGIKPGRVIEAAESLLKGVEAGRAPGE